MLTAFLGRSSSRIKTKDEERILLGRRTVAGKAGHGRTTARRGLVAG